MTINILWFEKHEILLWRQQIYFENVRYIEAINRAFSCAQFKKIFTSTKESGANLLSSEEAFNNRIGKKFLV